MIDATDRNSAFIRFAPPVVGVLLIFLFVKLGMWQLDRAAEKIATEEAFYSPGSYTEVIAASEPPEFAAIEAYGDWLTNRQVLIDNAISHSRLGYFVITPFRLRDGSVMLVNRGWVPKDQASGLPDTTIAEREGVIRGRAGRLPRVGIRPGEAFADRDSWPRIAVWPTNDEIAAEIGQPVVPFVMLLDPDQPFGFERRWEPVQTMGPSKHYGYAFQWFAMATAVLLILGWQLNKQRKRRK